MKVSDLFVRSLENEGVKFVFGVPGEENEDLLFSLKDSSVKFVPTRHEQGGAFMANVWGRITGKAGVCLATLGPGATNLVTGVADANMDKAPVVALTAQGSLNRLHHESHQYLDVVSMFQPITKWNTSVKAPETVAEVVRKAFKEAEYEKPGATHIELSEDVAKMLVNGAPEPLPIRRVRRPGPDYKAMEETVELLKAAKRPLIVAGNGAIRKLASKHLRRFVEAHQVPVVSTFMGKGAVSDFSDLSLLSVGFGFMKDFVMEAFEAADLVMTVGYDIAECSPAVWNLGKKKKLVHIDFVPAEVYADFVPDVEVVGDISGALWDLNRRLEGQDLRYDTNWFRPIRQKILDDVASYDLAEGKPLTVPGTLNVIRDTMSSNGLLISDVGSHKMWVGRNYMTATPNGCIISNGLASMGIALPGAVAASLTARKRQVVAVMGDGGFMMNSQELETAQRLGVSFTAVVFNDNDYGLISWKQKLSRGASTSTKLTNPDFKAYVESFGIAAYRPETAAEVDAVLREAIPSPGVKVVEIPIDPSVNTGLAEKLEEYWRK